MTGGSPEPGFLRCQLGLEDRLVLDDRHDQAAADDLVGLREGALGRLAGGKLDDLHVLFLDLGASCRSAAATTTGWVGVFTVLTGWFCMKL